MSGGFRRSGTFAVVGVIVVAGLVAVIGLTMGQGESNPKLALGLIFGLVALFMAGVFALQRSDLNRASGAGALRAREEVWGVARSSHKLGIVVTVLIFLTVPAIYLTESFLPLLIGGPLIVLAALYGAFRAIGPGGAIEQSYALTDRAMAPLGLAVAVRIGGHEDAGTTEVLVGEPSAGYEASSKRISVRSGPEGILVSRRKGDGRDWLCDLWLAERLAMD